MYKLPERNLYAIGDIHGCTVELNSILDFLENQQDFNEKDQLIFLGDYIDRGTSTCKVLDKVIDFKNKYPNTICLRGNHEDMFLDFIGLDGSFGEWHVVNGGDKFFKELKLNHLYRQSMDNGTTLKISKEDFRQQIPEKYVNFIKETQIYAEFDKFFFVHAGIDLTKGFDDQTNQDFLWVREDFLGQEHDYNKWIIHGHTITNEVYFNIPYEINLDTGCFTGNKLSCICLNVENPLTSVLYQVNADETKVIIK